MWIKKEEYKRIEKQVEHYKNLSGTYRIIVSDYLKDIQNLKEEIIEKKQTNKKIRSFKIAERHF